VDLCHDLLRLSFCSHDLLHLTLLFFLDRRGTYYDIIHTLLVGFSSRHKYVSHLRDGMYTVVNIYLEEQSSTKHKKIT